MGLLPFLLLALFVRTLEGRQCPKNSLQLRGDGTEPVGGGWIVMSEKYYIQHPWNLQLGQRFRLEHSKYIFEVHGDDAPFKEGLHPNDSGADPRTELATCTDYTEGVHQFAAKVTIPAGTEKVCIFQIKLEAPKNIPPNTFMLIVDEGGKLKTGPRNSQVLAKDVYGKELRLNVIYDANKHTADIYIDGTRKHTERSLFDGQAVEVYFKCGLYARPGGDRDRIMRATYRDISIYKRIGPARVDDQGEKYTVQAGHSLDSIATAHGMKLEVLVAANPQIQDPDEIFPGDVVNPHDSRSAELGSSTNCSKRQWRTGSLTVYDNTDEGDDPHAQQFQECEHVSPSFLDNVDVASIHGKFWNRDKYKKIYICWRGQEHVLQAWDACYDKDCQPKDGNDCCTRNIEAVKGSDYLVDVERQTLKRLFDVDSMEVREKIQYSLGLRVDYSAIARKYGAECDFESDAGES